LQKYNLFSEKEFNVMKKSLTSGDKVFTAGFQVLFDNKDFDDFYETITIALENHINKGDNKK
jgi:flagellar biosynthesis regulator FlbT